MEFLHSSTPLRALGAAALVVVVPLPLAACAGTGTMSHSISSELKAAAGADVFAEPSVEFFEVDSFTMTQPDPGALAALGIPHVDGAGSMQISDGVITAADLLLSTGVSGQDVSFILTEPLVLRREESAAEPLRATGTLTVAGIEHHGTRVTLTPSFPSGDRARLDVAFTVPDDLFSARAQSALPGVTDTLAATVTYAAQE